MRRIDKLLYHAVIPPFLIALIVLTFVVSIRELGLLSELLITRNASLATIGLIAGSILPRILMFSLPLSYLIGILIGLSGLAGESQITALRACGIPLRTLLRPILILGCFVGLATGAITAVILPHANYSFSSIKERISVSHVTSRIQPRVFNEDLPKIVFYVDDVAADKQFWSRVFLADNTDPANPRTVVARSGTWVSDPSGRRLQIHLEDGASYAMNPGDPAKDNVSLFDATDIPIDLGPELHSAGNNREKKVIELSTLELLSHQEDDSQTTRLERTLEFHRRTSLPFAVFPFALLGLTLAASTPRAGRTSGFALSLVVVMLFYVLFLNGLRLASVGKLTPWMGAWGANILLTMAGLFLLSRIEHGTRAVLLSKFGATAVLRRINLGNLAGIWNRPGGRIRIERFVRILRFFFPKTLDLYISRGFMTYLFWSLISCGTLFVLFTLFDLLDDIIRHNIPAIYVIEYFIFLTPQILMLVVPMSALLAVLINFGVLEKNSEITAIKAGGWSLYRIAVPVALITSGLCVGLFLLQDYVLPRANVRQDSIRNMIKGRPPQTSLQLQRKWIFGEAHRIYNYEYFDSNQDSFVDLNIYDIDMDGVTIVRRIHSSRARITPAGEWILEDGWVRDYAAAREGFRRIHNETFRFPEKASYFEAEIFQPKESSKRTYFELKNYINYLQKSGYNATELQVELNKKMAFPLSCLVMTLLGVPFSFSTGRKGAFFGIGVSIAIAISYWGISGVFEAMGAYGLLVPALAAWAPNIIFGGTGLALLFTIRT